MVMVVFISSADWNFRESILWKKVFKVIGIIIAVGIILFAGFTIVSHAVYHRSDMATAVEIYFRMTGEKV